MQLPFDANSTSHSVLTKFDLNRLPYKNLYSTLLHLIDFMTGQPKLDLLTLLEATCSSFGQTENQAFVCYLIGTERKSLEMLLKAELICR